MPRLKRQLYRKAAERRPCSRILQNYYLRDVVLTVQSDVFNRTYFS